MSFENGNPGYAPNPKFSQRLSLSLSCMTQKVSDVMMLSF